ncbi:MAG: hypothetical protein ACKV2Q_24765 [Planctomycetaceae bacterium]
MRLRDLRQLRLQRRQATHPQSLFISGGIGDVIALTCALDVPNSIETVYYATRNVADVMSYLATLCPDHTRHEIVWSDWSERWAWYSLAEFVRSTGRADIADAEDWSIASVFPRDLPFRGLPWQPGHPLSSIHDVRLPDRYAVMQPFSSDKRDPRRDFTAAEIMATLAACREQSLPVVLLNRGDDPLLVADGLINLQNQTNIYGSIDITIGAHIFIGIDSAMSQVATKVMPANRLLIKSVNPHYYRHLHWYCTPHTTTPFVVNDVVPRLTQLEW